MKPRWSGCKPATALMLSGWRIPQTLISIVGLTYSGLYLLAEVGTGGSRILVFHKVLSHQKALKARLTQSLVVRRRGNSAFGDRHQVPGQLGCQVHRVFQVHFKIFEVAVVDAHQL